MRNYLVILFLFFTSIISGLSGQTAEPNYDVADSLIVFEKRNLIWPPLLIKFQDQYLPDQTEPFYLSDYSNSAGEIHEIYFAFTQDKEFEDQFPGEFTYYAKGLSISLIMGRDFEKIYRDELWNHTLSDTIKFSVPVSSLLSVEKEGRYSIKFDSLIRVDSKGRKVSILKEYDYPYDFYLFKERDPIAEQYGLPGLILLVNGKKYAGKTPLKNSAKVTLTLEINPELLKNHPEECSYQIHGADVAEKNCFGPQIKESNRSKSGWGSAPVLEIPMKNLDISAGGEFYVFVGSIYRKGADGRIYTQISNGDELERFRALTTKFYLKY